MSIRMQLPAIIRNCFLVLEDEGEHLKGHDDIEVYPDQGTTTRLPTELFLKVFAHLDDKDLLETERRVCRRWKVMADDIINKRSYTSISRHATAEPDQNSPDERPEAVSDTISAVGGDAKLIPMLHNYISRLQFDMNKLDRNMTKTSYGKNLVRQNVDSCKYINAEISFCYTPFSRPGLQQATFQFILPELLPTQVAPNQGKIRPWIFTVHKAAKEGPLSLWNVQRAITKYLNETVKYKHVYANPARDRKNSLVQRKQLSEGFKIGTAFGMITCEEREEKNGGGRVFIIQLQLDQQKSLQRSRLQAREEQVGWEWEWELELAQIRNELACWNE